MRRSEGDALSLCFNDLFFFVEFTSFCRTFLWNIFLKNVWYNVRAQWINATIIFSEFPQISSKFSQIPAGSTVERVLLLNSFYKLFFLRVIIESGLYSWAASNGAGTVFDMLFTQSRCTRNQGLEVFWCFLIEISIFSQQKWVNWLKNYLICFSPSLDVLETKD